VIQVTVDKVGVDVETNQAVMLLQDRDGKKMLPIWIGPIEASAIALGLQGLNAPRPLTCDLTKAVIDAFNSRMVMALITELKEETFYAQIILDVGDRVVEIDARPSDAVALALRTGSPIYVSEWVLEEAGVVQKDEPIN
jgi:bifunctional DNase/RNase